MGGGGGVYLPTDVLPCVSLQLHAMFRFVFSSLLSLIAVFPATILHLPTDVLPCVSLQLRAIFRFVFSSLFLSLITVFPATLLIFRQRKLKSIVYSVYTITIFIANLEL